MQFVVQSQAFTFRIKLEKIFSQLIVLFFLYEISHYNYVDLSRNQGKVVKMN